MKRKGNLYPAIYDFDNIVSAYKEVCRNTKKLKEKYIHLNNMNVSMFLEFAIF